MEYTREELQTKTIEELKKIKQKLQEEKERQDLINDILVIPYNNDNIYYYWPQHIPNYCPPNYKNPFDITPIYCKRL